MAENGRLSPGVRLNRILRTERAPVCLFLGFEADQNVHASYASRSNRCFGMDKSHVIDPAIQLDFCLSSEYVTCPVYLARISTEVSPSVPDSLQKISERFLRGKK